MKKVPWVKVIQITSLTLMSLLKARSIYYKFKRGP